METRIGGDAARGGVALPARAAGPGGAGRRCPATAPSPLPPVRIFLGTEEGQYRAERVFVWSILQVRDPARVYEIHLMKNLAGFDRRGWRTGFTCYRFAIPDFAGRTRQGDLQRRRPDLPRRPGAAVRPAARRPRLPRDRRPRHLGDADRLREDAALVEPGRGLGARRQGPAHQQARPRCRACGASSTGTGTRATSNMSRAAPGACTTRPCTSSPGTRSPKPTPTTRTRWPISGTISSARRTPPASRCSPATSPSPGFRGGPGLEPADGAGAAAAPLLSGGRERLLRQTGARSLLIAGMGGAPEPPWRRRARGHPPRFRPRARAGCPSERVRRRGRRRHLRAHPGRRRRAGCCASCSPRPSARWCCGSRVTRRGGRGQRGLVATPASRRSPRTIPAVSWELDAVRRSPPARSRSTATQVRRVEPPPEPAGLGADRRGRGRGPAGPAGRRGPGLAVRGEAAGLRAARVAARPAARRHGRHASIRPARRR